MPWQGVCPMELRMRLVNALMAEEDNTTAVCEEYGVSRKTGYKWLSRFRAQGPAGLAERSRAPQVVPWAISQAQAEAIVGLRRQHQAASLAAQQCRFDHFRAEFNHERPHEALGQAVPVAVYTPSSRPYPARLEDPGRGTGRSGIGADARGNDTYN